VLSLYLSLIALLICSPLLIPHYGFIVGAVLSIIGTGCLYLFLSIEEKSRWGKMIARWWPLSRAPRSYDLDQGELDPEEIEYIHNIRNESHETEIVITVGLFAGLMVIDLGSIDGFLWSLPFSFSPNQIGIIYTALVISVWLLRIGIFTHLLLRCIWIGIVGLGFSYPRGINRLRLGGPFQRRIYHHLTAPDTSVRLTIQMERLCSLLYATLMCSVFSLLAWTVLGFVCLFAGTHISYQLEQIAHSLSWDFNRNALLPFTVLLCAIGVFSAWSFIRVSTYSVICSLRQPIIEIFYFFKGTLLSQNTLAIPLIMALPPMCIVIGIRYPAMSVEESQNYVYLDEVRNREKIEVPHIASAIIEKPVLHLQLPERTVKTWQSHAEYTCLSPSSEVWYEIDELNKWSNKEFGVWIDRIPVSEVVWVQKGAEAILDGFIELKSLDDGMHVLSVDPCSQIEFVSGIEIPFYLNLGER
jgi:hypothetical protein